MNPQPTAPKPSTKPKSPASRGLPGNGGTRTARWRAAAQVQSGPAAYIRDRPAEHFDRNPEAARLPSGLRFLDIGCGGGILCEPLARLGAIGGRGRSFGEEHRGGASPRRAGGLAIDYRDTTAEQLADAGERFDVVLAMEVVEHVADVGLFVARCAEMVKPGGLMIVATINRTLKASRSPSSAPNTCCAGCRAAPINGTSSSRRTSSRSRWSGAACVSTDERGVIYNLFADRWQLSRDTDVNYMVVAERPA